MFYHSYRSQNNDKTDCNTAINTRAYIVQCVTQVSTVNKELIYNLCVYYKQAKGESHITYI